jgi:ferrochelatase
LSPGATRPPAGVLLVNLGSPEAPTPQALRAFLGEFLSDPRVVPLPGWIWQPLLRGLVLPLRSPRSAELYRRVWTPEGAPLLAIGQRQAAALGARLGPGFVVRLAMRYGRPSIFDGLHALRAAGCAPLVLLPLFPQEAEATTGSVRAAARLAAAGLGPRVELLDTPPYYDDAPYVRAVAERCRAAGAGRRIAHHVFSFHGLPVRQDHGGVYSGQCRATASAVAAALGLHAEEWTLVWQSRFGPVEWLQPYAVDAVPALARRHKRVLVACPGFVADCLETLDEIGHLLARQFLLAGGEELVLAPCVNDDPGLIETLAGLVQRAVAAPVGAPA